MKTKLFNVIEMRLYYLTNTNPLYDYKRIDYAKERQLILDDLKYYNTEDVISEIRVIEEQLNLVDPKLMVDNFFNQDYDKNYPYIPEGLYYNKVKRKYYPSEDYKNLYSKAKMTEINTQIEADFQYREKMIKKHRKLMQQHLGIELKDINDLLKEITLLLAVTKPEKNYPNHIFTQQGYTLFCYLLEEFVCPIEKSGHHSDIVYCYHRLKTDNFIIQNITPFLEWYSDKYGVDIQAKTFNQVKNDIRDKLYSNVTSKL